MEEIAEKNKFPIIGPACGYYCYQLARMINAKSIFELGSGYGYSTAWFAKAVRENGGGVVHHTVWDDGLSKSAREHLSAMGTLDIVQFHNAEAVETLRQTAGPFDIIFNDIDKDGYPNPAGDQGKTSSRWHPDHRQHALAWTNTRPERS